MPEGAISMSRGMVTVFASRSRGSSVCGARKAFGSRVPHLRFQEFRGLERFVRGTLHLLSECFSFGEEKVRTCGVIKSSDQAKEVVRKVEPVLFDVESPRMGVAGVDSTYGTGKQDAT